MHMNSGKTETERDIWDRAFSQARSAGKLWHEAVREADSQLLSHREAES